MYVLMVPETLVSLLHGCSKKRFLRSGLCLHALSVKAGYQSMFICNHILNMYAKCGRLCYAHQVFDEMLERNVVTWSALISGYDQAGNHVMAVDLFSKMLLGEEPNEFIYGSALSSCASLMAPILGQQIHAHSLRLVVHPVDPLFALGDIAKSNGIWFHVDDAYAGSAFICPELRHYIDGVEEADSFNMNAHKWFLTNFDCSALWVKDRSALIHSLSTNPEFLKNKASENKMVVDYKDWQIPLGRCFRSLKLWMVLRLYGVEKLQAYIRNHINLAKQFEDLVSQDPRFEIVVPRKLSLVCFRLLHPRKDEECTNKLNHDLLDALNSSGKIYLSHTVMQVLSNKYTLRFAIGAPLTEERHIVAAWNVFQDQASSLLARL